MSNVKSEIKEHKKQINRIANDSVILKDVISGNTTLEEIVSDMIKEYWGLAQITSRTDFLGRERKISDNEGEIVERFNEKISDLNRLLSGFDYQLKMPDLFTYGDMKRRFKEACSPSGMVYSYPDGCWVSDYDNINRYGIWLNDVEKNAISIREKTKEIDETIKRVYAVDYFSSKPELFREIYQRMDWDYRRHVEGELKERLELGVLDISQLELERYLRGLVNYKQDKT